MARGIIITAKGVQLNMDELITKSTRPLQTQDHDLKDKVKARRIPAAQPRMRGFVPSAAGVAALEPSDSALPAAGIKSGSVADYTGITIEKPIHLKEKPENAMDTANDTLREIMADLKSNTPQQTAVTKSRPTRKS